MLLIVKGLLVNLFFYLMLLGWGYLVTKLLARRDAVHIGKLAVIGAAFLIYLGGVLTFCKAYSSTLGLLIIATGLLAAMTYLYYRSEMLSRIAVIPAWGWLTLLFVAWRVGASVMGGLNSHDDLHGYLQLPVRIIQTGTMAADFFNERRLVVFGGQSFLQAMYLQLTPLNWANGLDNGVGILLILSVALATFPGFLENKSTNIIIILLCAVLQFKAINISGTYIGAAFLLYLLTETVFHQETTKSNAIIFGLVAAGCIATKNYMLLPIIGTLFVWGVERCTRDDVDHITPPAVCLGSTLLLLVPWMMLSYRACGTIFFPLAGIGNHGSRFGLLQLTSSNPTPLVTMILQLKNYLIQPESLVCLFGITLFRIPFKTREQKLYFFNIIVLLICTWLIVWKSMFIMRYSASLLGVGSIMTLLLLLRAEKIVAASLCLLFLVLYNYKTVNKIYLPSWQKHNNYESTFGSTRSSLRKMQSLIPVDAPIAVFLSYPFLLDFARNPVHVFDHYGGACPPPGLPVSGEQQLKKYLLGLGIRYIAYSYGDEANFSRKDYGSRLISDGTPLKDRFKQIASLTFQFQAMLIKLRQTEKVIYDDGAIFLLDLNRHTDKELTQ